MQTITKILTEKVSAAFEKCGYDKALGAVGGDDQALGMAKAMVLEIPIRNFVTMSSGVFSEEMANGLLMILNGEKPAFGLGKIVAGLAGAIMKLPDLLKAI